MFFQAKPVVYKDPQAIVIATDLCIATTLPYVGMHLINVISKEAQIAFSMGLCSSTPLHLAIGVLSIAPVGVFLYVCAIYARQIAEYAKDLYYQRPMNHKFEFLRQHVD